MSRRKSKVLILVGDPQIALAYSDKYDTFVLFNYNKEVHERLTKQNKKIYYCSTCVSDSNLKTLNYSEIAKLSKNGDTQVFIAVPFSSVSKVSIFLSALVELSDFYNYERGSLHCLSKHLWVAQENLGEVLEKAVKVSKKEINEFVNKALEYYHELLELATKLDLSFVMSYDDAMFLLRRIRSIRTELSAIIETKLISIVDAAFIQDFGSFKKNMYAAEEHLLEYIAYLVRKKKFCPACEEELNN